MIGRKVRTAMPLLAYEVLHDDGTIEINVEQNPDGSPKQVNIDQFSGQPFMCNDNGFICNDIMQFESAQSDSIARAVLSRCQILKSPSLPADMTVEDAFKQVVPANWSSPAEFVRLHLDKAHSDYLSRQVKNIEENTKEAIDKIAFAGTEDNHDS